MEFEQDPADEFLKREREELGDLENEIISSNVEPVAASPDENVLGLSSDDFEMINNDLSTESAENDDLTGMTFASSNISVVQEVPEKIKKWREEQAILIENKDIKEKEATEKLRESAANELKDWYLSYRDSKEKTKALNRSNEKEVASVDTNGTVSDDTQIWERIAALCDFGSQAKAPKNGRDTSRMRSIFLQLKSSPPAVKNI